MSVDRRQALAALLSAIADVNEQLPAERRIAVTPDAPLCGAGSTLDSLGLLNFLLFAEQRLEDAGCKVSLTSLPDGSDQNGPLRDVNALADFLSSRQTTAAERVQS